MSSKASYDPVGKGKLHDADDEAPADSEKTGGKSDGSKAEGFTVRVRRMDRRSWIILAGAGVLVALVVIVAVVVITQQKSGRPAFCSEKPDPGFCRAYFEMYHYDPETDSCKMFVYGGCDGNENKFKSMEDCEETCQAGNRTPEAEESKGRKHQDEEETDGKTLKKDMSKDAEDAESKSKTIKKN
jgi:hypothetical protein